MRRASVPQTDAERQYRLGFVSSVLATRQGFRPQTGSIFTPDGRFHRTKLDSIYPSVRETIRVLRYWQDG